MRLTAYIDGQRVGWFEQLATGAIALEYDPAWQSEGGRRELSWSMPKSRRKHTGAAPENYLWNLLPDNDLVLERWARGFSVSAGNPLALLARVGLDAAGAVQFVDSELHDELELRGPDGFELCSEADIAQRLRELRADPSAWVAPHASAGYFSLAGAQSKFTLLRTNAGWAVPKGTTGSTHIVKPGIPGYARSDLNEHLTMRAAALLGLRVAKSRIRHFEDQSAIVVTRFDRVRREDGTVERLHQEDFAQAAGVHPVRKYQDRGGPGIAQISRLVREQLGVRSDSEVRRLFEAALFNWASLSTDAHAKNYAIVYGRRSSAERSRTRPVLAPLYDLASALAYPGLNDRRAKLAMSFHGHYRAWDIRPRDIVLEAESIGLDAEWVLERARDLAGGLPAAFGEAAQEARLTGDDAVFATRLVDAASERSVVLLNQLG